MPCILVKCTKSGTKSGINSCMSSFHDTTRYDSTTGRSLNNVNSLFNNHRRLEYSAMFSSILLCRMFQFRFFLARSSSDCSCIWCIYISMIYISRYHRHNVHIPMPFSSPCDHFLTATCIYIYSLLTITSIYLPHFSWLFDHFCPHIIQSYADNSDFT